MDRRPLVFIILAIVLIFIASVLFPIWEFGGYYWNNSYAGVETWEYLTFFHIISGPFMFCAMFLFIATFVLLLITIISKKVGRKKAPYVVGIIMVSTVFVMGLIGAIAVAIVGATGDYDEWWFGGACFVGNIAPLLILPFLILSLIKVSKNKGKSDLED
ncbi:MAG: hypothetical protein ACMUHM_04565 [Thermoplasmatota archaeon]